MAHQSQKKKKKTDFMTHLHWGPGSVHGFPRLQIQHIFQNECNRITQITGFLCKSSFSIILDLAIGLPHTCCLKSSTASPTACKRNPNRMWRSIGSPSLIQLFISKQPVGSKCMLPTCTDLQPVLPSRCFRLQLSVLAGAVGTCSSNNWRPPGWERLPYNPPSSPCLAFMQHI